MIRFNQFSLARGSKPLFEKVTVSLNPGERAGLIGANGAGKSTLFSVLLGQLGADGGEIAIPPTWRIAHVSQDTPALTASALDYVLDGDRELREIEARIAAASAAGDGASEAEAHAAFADADGYTARARAETLLTGLGFALDALSGPVASFSGGWRMRLNLAQALMSRSDLLLLDEPTNHLDLDAIVWLEDWLRRYRGTLVIISHDREFLDAICNVILHLENRQLRRYGGNYSQFEVLRAQQLMLQQSSYEKQQKTVAHLESFINRFKAKASKARQAQSRVKALEKMELIAPVYAASPFTFQFREAASAPDPMLVIDEASCGYREASGAAVPILKEVTLSIQNGLRIGLLGANGQGKSTLIKTLAGELAPLAGQVQRGKGLEIGYFAQHQLETLRLDDSPLKALGRLAPQTREQELRDFLGSFNFRGEMATAPIAPLSGGEKARLALALIIWRKPNLLLLDEPTNHLDLETRHALTSALAQFNGTLIVVSHDRHLLRATTDQFLLVAQHQVRPFDGDLDDYRAWLLQDASQRARPAGDARAGLAASRDGADTAVASNAATRSAQGVSPAETARTDNASDPGKRREQRRATAQDRQRLAQERRPLQKKIETLEKKIAELERQKDEADAFIAHPSSYDAGNKTALTDTLRRQAELKASLQALENEWLEAQERLEQID